MAFEAFVVLSTILLPFKPSVVDAVFWITLFEAVFIASVATLVAAQIFYLYQEVCIHCLNFYQYI